MAMFIEFTSVITHKVAIGDDGIEGVTHSVEINADSAEASALGATIIYAIVQGGCRSVLRGLEQRENAFAAIDGEDEDDEF